ncbi:protein-S-isoprenylcysteine O-methyltransferase Ste14 [Mesorhizobium jarvisii]
MRPATAIALLWLVWVVTWIAAAMWADPAKKRATIGAEVRYRVFWLAGTVLLFVPAHGYEGRLRLWTPSLAEAWACIALIAIGLIFSWWARIHLGRLWSASVTAKADHRVGDCQEFRVRAGIMGKKDSHYDPTQRTCDTE